MDAHDYHHSTDRFLAFRFLVRSNVIPIAAYCLAVVALLASSNLFAGTYRTANFIVSAPTNALAQELGESAEQWREKLSIEWIGEAMPNWAAPCKIVAHVSPTLGAGGATTFVFDRGEVTGWDMEIQGSRERVLDSVLPHEITHTIFASYFRRPLPRWADEGACTTVEHRSEIGKQERLLIEFLKTGKGIPFSQMFAMKEYPPEILPLYAQGHSLTQFLLERRGKEAFLTFIEDGMQDENWRRAVDKHYGHENLYALQETWLDWVRQGRPQLPLEADIAAKIASNNQPTIIRGQGPVTPVTASGPTQGGRPSVYAIRPDASRNNEQTSVYDASRPQTPIWR